VLRCVEPGIKDAARRLRRSPSAILDTVLDAARSAAAAGTKERRFWPNQGTAFGSDGTHRGEMRGGLTGRFILPGAPEHADPGSGEDADGVGMIASARVCAAIDGFCPGGGVARIVGEAGDGGAQSSVEMVGFVETVFRRR